MTEVYFSKTWSILWYHDTLNYSIRLSSAVLVEYKETFLLGSFCYFHQYGCHANGVNYSVQGQVWNPKIRLDGQHYMYLQKTERLQFILNANFPRQVQWEDKKPCVRGEWQITEPILCSKVPTDKTTNLKPASWLLIQIQPSGDKKMYYTQFELFCKPRDIQLLE